MKNFIFSMLALTIFTFAACPKDVSIAEVVKTGDVKTDGVKNSDSTINANINVPESAGVVYVYKGVETPASDIDFIKNEELVDATSFIIGDSRHYIFDNDVELEAWAYTLSNPNAKDALLNLIADATALKQIAINTNAAAELDSKGDAPAAYKIQANNYWQNKYGTRPIPESLATIYDSCNPDPYKALWLNTPSTIIYYYPGVVRNKMSYIEALGVTSDVFATKSFFRGPKWYFWPPGSVFGKSLCGHWFNNSNVSCISGY